MHHIFKTTRLLLPYMAVCFMLMSASNSFSAFGQNQTKEEIQSKIKVLQETSNFKKDTAYINLLYKLGRAYFDYNLDSLLINSNEIISLSKTINYTKGEAYGYLNKGIYYSDIGNQNQAISCFSESLAKGKAINSIEIILKSKNELGKEYNYKDEYAKALKEYLEGIKIAEEHKKEDYLSVYYVNLSVLYSNQKEYDQTIYFLNKAIALNKKNGDKKITGMALSNLAFTYIQIGDLTNASLKVKESIAIFEKLKIDTWLTYVYELEGTIYIKQKQFNKALVWLKKSEALYEKIDQDRYKMKLYLLMSKAYFGLHKYKTSEAYAIKSLNLSKEFHLLANRDDILEILYKIKKINNDAKTALLYLEEFKAVTDTINKNKNKKELRILKSNLAFEQEKEQYILDNEQKYIKQRSYIFISILIIIAFFIIIIILKRNNKTQNILNQKLIENTEALKKNQTYLNDVNKTKNKLFSIIAHDLKGPINSFKSLFDLFYSNDLSKKEFMTFIPQIGENIDSIAFTLNNLLTWGQTQMNGLITEPSFTIIKTLVDENIGLLSKLAKAKSIQTINTIPPNVVGWCDRNQIDIVIRNLISNAVKFTRTDGTITISALEKEEFWQIEIKDNGVGINKGTLANIFKDESTLISYGTMHEKGTGLGLKVCKEMVRNNGGHIWVESELNQGSSFYFTVPKSNKK